jgi:hypothetical protein
MCSTKAGGHRRASVIHRFDEVDAPTWRVHLGAQGTIGGTFIETQAAMDTRSNFLAAAAQTDQNRAEALTLSPVIIL